MSVEQKKIKFAEGFRVTESRSQWALVALRKQEQMFIVRRDHFILSHYQNPTFKPSSKLVPYGTCYQVPKRRGEERDLDVI